MYFDGVDFNTAQAELAVEDNRVHVFKSGYYRVNAWMDQHGQGGHYRLVIQRNDKDVAVSHNYRHTEGGWHQQSLDMYWPFQVGDTMRVRVHAEHARGDTYLWHSWNKRGRHSRLQVRYVGSDAQIWSGGCKAHARGLQPA